MAKRKPNTFTKTELNSMKKLLKPELYAAVLELIEKAKKNGEVLPVSVAISHALDINVEKTFETEDNTIGEMSSFGSKKRKATSAMNAETLTLEESVDETKVTILSSEYNSLVESNEELRERAKALEAEVSSLRTTKSEADIEAELEAIRAEAKENQAKIQLIVAEARRWKERFVDARNRLAVKSSDYDKVSAALYDQFDRVDAMRAENDEKVAGVKDQLNLQIMELKKKYDQDIQLMGMAMDAARERFLKEIEDSHKEASTVLNELAAEYEERMKKANQDATETLDALQKEFEERLNASENRAKALQEQLEQQQAQHSKTKKVFRAVSVVFITLVVAAGLVAGHFIAKTVSLNRSNAHLEEKNQSQTRYIDDLEEKNDDLNDIIGDKDNQIKDKDNIIDDKTKENEEQKGTIKDLEDKNKDLEEKVNDYERILDSLRTKTSDNSQSTDASSGVSTSLDFENRTNIIENGRIVGETIDITRDGELVATAIEHEDGTKQIVAYEYDDNGNLVSAVTTTFDKDGNETGTIVTPASEIKSNEKEDVVPGKQYDDFDKTADEDEGLR